MSTEWTQDGEDAVLVARSRKTGSTAVEVLRIGLNSQDKVTFSPELPGSIDAQVGTEAGDAIDVICQLKDAFGNPAGGAVEVLVTTLAETADKGDIAAASTPVGTLVKAVNPATGANTAWLTTTDAGAFSVSVTDSAAEDVVLTVLADGHKPLVLKLTFA
jgi:hypothetical protein